MINSEKYWLIYYIRKIKLGYDLIICKKKKAHMCNSEDLFLILTNSIIIYMYVHVVG